MRLKASSVTKALRGMTMRRFLTDPTLLGPFFADPSWAKWVMLLCAVMGEPLSPQECLWFTEITGRIYKPGTRVDEIWLVIGRRGGKSFAIAALGVYFSVCFDYADRLAIGERALIPILAAAQNQATKIFSYITGIFDKVVLLRPLVERQTSDTIGLVNRIDIMVRPASYRTIRGQTCPLVICDEIAFWYVEGVNPDAEIVNAARPGLATLNGVLAVISSPYSKRGELWENFKRYFDGHDPNILIAKAPSWAMHPTLNARFLARAKERDPQAYDREYGAEFSSDIVAFVDRDLVESLVVRDRIEVLPAQAIQYHAFADPSGGGSDAFALAIAHSELENDTVVLDCLRMIWPPFDPSVATVELCNVLKRYNINRVTGDKYVGHWPEEQFNRNGVTYEFSERSKSEIYVELLPLLNARKVELLESVREH